MKEGKNIVGVVKFIFCIMVHFVHVVVWGWGVSPVNKRDTNRV